ncbi:MAG: ABC transporter permease [Candidatus Asgardarchaeia archaeon]
MKLKSMFNQLLGILPVVVFIISWEFISKLNIIPSYLFPPFSQVIISFIELTLNGELPYHFFRSFMRVMIGFTLGASTGIIVGIGMGYNSLLEKTLNPILYLLYPIPALGWLPLLLIWIGINDILPIALIFICSFFPLLYNTITGVKSVDPKLIKVAKTLGATELQILSEIVIPLALPNIFTGLKLESGMAWRTVLAAEMIAMPVGLGALSMKAQSLLMIDVIIDVLVVLSLICLLFEKVLELLERKLTAEWM